MSVLLLFATALVVVFSRLLFDTRTVAFGGTARPGPEIWTSRLALETSLFDSALSLQDTIRLISCNSDQGDLLFFKVAPNFEVLALVSFSIRDDQGHG